MKVRGEFATRSKFHYGVTAATSAIGGPARRSLATLVELRPAQQYPRLQSEVREARRPPLRCFREREKNYGLIAPGVKVMVGLPSTAVTAGGGSGAARERLGRNYRSSATGSDATGGATSAASTTGSSAGGASEDVSTASPTSVAWDGHVRNRRLHRTECRGPRVPLPLVAP